MDIARIEFFEGKINVKFKQFADDYVFKVRPCIAGRPRINAKVEAPMKILDEIRVYNGKLDYDGLNKFIAHLNNRVNTSVVKVWEEFQLCILIEKRLPYCTYL